MRKLFTLFAAMVCAAMMMAQKSGVLRIPTVEHATITVTRGGSTLANGDVITEGDELVINYAATNPYYIVGETSQTVTLTAAMFTNSGEFLTPDYLADSTPVENYYGHSGWTGRMYARHGYTGGTSVYITMHETGVTKIAFAWSLEHESLDYGTFQLGFSINGGLPIDVLHDFSTAPNPKGTIFLDTITYTGTGNDQIEWYFMKETDGTLEDAGRPFFLGEINIVSDELRYDVHAPKVQRDYTIEFDPRDHVNLAVTLDGVPFTGGTVHVGETLHYKVVTDNGYYFDGLDSSVEEWPDIVLAESNFDGTGKWVIAPTYVPYLRVLDPQVKMIDANTAKISWDGFGGAYSSFRLAVSDKELSGNPDYWRGLQHLTATETEYTVEGLTENTLYYVYLEGTADNIARAWVTKTFTAREPGGPCDLTIDMYDDYGDGWNNNGFYIKEGKKSTFITLESGQTGTKYYPASHENVQLVWHSGEFADEVGFTITNGDGDTIMNVPAGGVSFYGDEVIFEGRVCPPECTATVSNLIGNVTGTNFSFSWDAVGADHFEVAIVQKSKPTDEDIEAAAVVVNQNNYSFTGKQYGGYHAFVRPVCADGNKGDWDSMLLHGDFPTDPEAQMAALKSLAQPITLDYVHSGDIMEDAALFFDSGDMFPYLIYSLNLTDSTDVEIAFFSPDITGYHEFDIYQDTVEGKPLELIHSAYADSFVKRMKGKIYIFMYEEYELGHYTMLIREHRELQAEQITLPFNTSGNYVEAALDPVPYSGNPAYAKMYAMQLADTTDVRIFWSSSDAKSVPDANMRYWVFMNEIDDGHRISDGYPGEATVTMLKDSLYYLIFYVIPEYGGLPSLTDTLSIVDASTHVPEPVVARDITLDFTEETDLTDGMQWLCPFYGTYCPTKFYRLHVTDTTQVMLYANSSDFTFIPSPNMLIMMFENEVDMSRVEYYNVMNYNPVSLELAKDSTYYVAIVAIPEAGGSAEFSYSIRIADVTDPTPITPITPDVFIDDTADDFIRGAYHFGKAYEFVVTEDSKQFSFSLEYLGDDPEDLDDLRLSLYEDTISSSTSITSIGALDGALNYDQFTGNASGKHYFFVVMARNPVDFRFTLRADPDYDNLPVKGTVTVGEANQSQLSVRSGFSYHNTSCTYGWKGTYEAYQVALEKDKEYMIMMHKSGISGAGLGLFGGLSASVFQPGAQQGTYDDNLKASECQYSSSEDWVVLHFPSDSTVVDTFMLDAYLYTKFYDDVLDYEFSVEEVTDLVNLVEAAPLLRNADLPYAESGVFSDNKKVMPDVTYDFHSGPYAYYIEEYGAYDALARKVRIAVGDTLYVEFGGDEDAVIQIYEGTSMTLLRTIDDVPYSFPYESGYIVNEGTDSVEYAVVCSFNEVMIADAAWSLRLSKKEKDMEPVVVEPQLSADGITVYESSGVAAVQAELAQLIITAVDGDDNIVATIDNNPFLWDIDLTNDLAFYELNAQDLPLGYTFATATCQIGVIISRIPDLPSAIDEIETVTVPARKVMHNGQIYIVTEFGTFDLFGRKVK